MEYKGYTARVVFDDEAGVLFGEVEGLRDVVTFEATNVPELEAAFRDSVEDYLEMCAKRGKEPEKPYSGKFLVRIDPRIHRDIAMAAARAGKSFNAFAGEVLKSWIEHARHRTADRGLGALPTAAPSTRKNPANASTVKESAPAFLSGPTTGAIADSRQRSPAVISPTNITQHTPGSITPARDSRTPSESRTPAGEPQTKHAA